MKIYCTGCKVDVEARLTDGSERYPHRPDLASIPFYHCDDCGAWVGTHHKSTNPLKPMGTLATPEILDARKKIHALLDPLWREGFVSRGRAYAFISEALGVESFHAGEIRTIQEARAVYKVILQLEHQLKSNLAKA